MFLVSNLPEPVDRTVSTETSPELIAGDLAVAIHGGSIRDGEQLSSQSKLSASYGISKSAADRILDHLASLLTISPARRPRKDTVYIVDGTLIPTRDRSIAASSKNYRYSTNLQAVIDANSRLVAISISLPGSRNGCQAFTESGDEFHLR